jgi:hypothetical protein
VGLNGTVVSAPHCEQTVRVSGREPAAPEVLFDLQFLQRFGSFLNCLSWKNNCSPAVKTKSLPQSTHFKILSTYSIPRPLPTATCVVYGSGELHAGTGEVKNRLKTWKRALAA